MKAVIAHAFGPPESFSLEEVATRQPGPGEARVAVRAVAAGQCGLSASPPLQNSERVVPQER